MYRKLFCFSTAALLALSLSACNMGPESGPETDEGSLKELSEQTDALVWQGAPPTCYGLRDYFKWVCQDGQWGLSKVGQRDIWCDGTVFLSGYETDCHTDYATYNCNGGGGCGSLVHVCSPKPNRFCRRPSFGGIQFPTMELAP